jgi:hypothetical protein
MLLVYGQARERVNKVPLRTRLNASIFTGFLQALD